MRIGCCSKHLYHVLLSRYPCAIGNLFHANCSYQTTVPHPDFHRDLHTPFCITFLKCDMHRCPLKLSTSGNGLVCLILTKRRAPEQLLMVQKEWVNGSRASDLQEQDGIPTEAAHEKRTKTAVPSAVTVGDTG